MFGTYRVQSKEDDIGLLAPALARYCLNNPIIENKMLSTLSNKADSGVWKGKTLK